MTTAGIEPASFRFVAQHLNHCATVVPLWLGWGKNLFFASVQIGSGACWYRRLFIRGCEVHQLPSSVPEDKESTEHYVHG